MEMMDENLNVFSFFPIELYLQEEFWGRSLLGVYGNPIRHPQTWNALCLFLQAKLANGSTILLSSCAQIIFDSPTLTACLADLKLQHQTLRQSLVETVSPAPTTVHS